MSEMTSAEAARQLQVSDREIRRLVASGELPGRKLAGRVLVGVDAVESRSRSGPSRGRPFSPRVAWGILWELSGERAAWLAASERSRARRWLRTTRAATLALACRKRSELAALRSLPRYITEISSRPDVAISGVTAADAVGADIAAPGVVEIYCTSVTKQTLIRDFAMTRSGVSNVLIRVPTLEIDDILGGRRLMPEAVIAVDLLDSSDVRTRRAGRALIDELLQALPR